MNLVRLCWPLAAALVFAFLGCGQGTVTPLGGDADLDADADGDRDGGGCGDGICSINEDADRCPADCSALCGDGLCTHDETGESCPVDCSAGACGDSVCAEHEDAAVCPEDCLASCGNGLCDGGEAAASCPGDCPGSCGDGACTHDETPAGCPADCDVPCGDGFCSEAEDAGSCPADCPAVCGDGLCTGTEEACACAADCPAVCGDGCCDGSEAGSCAPDCGVSPLTCACDGAFLESSWVRAVVASPAGAPGLAAGSAGWVVAGQSAPFGLELLVDWHGWTGGGDGDCGLAGCGTCTPAGSSRFWVHCADVGAALGCACGGAFVEGERVEAAVASPSGATGLAARTDGTIVAAQAAPGDREILVEWDGWTAGHDGTCADASCGTCAPSGTSRWWVRCDEIQPIDAARQILGCACAGSPIRDGAIVEAAVATPAEASGLGLGTRGLVIAGRAEPGGLEILVEWWGWTAGHAGYCDVADCGTCTSSGSSRWWVACDEVTVLVP